MLEELLENLAEAHRELVIAQDFYDRQVNEVIRFLTGGEGDAVHVVQGPR